TGLELARNGRRLREAVRGRMTDESHRLGESSRRLRLSATTFVRARAGQGGHAAAKLGTVTRACPERERLPLEKHEARQRLLDPEAVLRRGFVLVRGAEDRILTSASDVEVGADLSLRFRDGVVRARAEQKQLHTGKADDGQQEE